MTFWDSSALVCLLSHESRFQEMLKLLMQDRREVVVWWATSVECQSSLQRRQRNIPQPLPSLQKSLQRLADLLEDADTVPPTEKVRRGAGHLLAAYSLRAADALQLAAALVACGDRPTGVSFVCLDDRLREAAQRRGFTVLPAD